MAHFKNNKPLMFYFTFISLSVVYRYRHRPLLLANLLGQKERRREKQRLKTNLKSFGKSPHFHHFIREATFIEPLIDHPSTAFWSDHHSKSEFDPNDEVYKVGNGQECKHRPETQLFICFTIHAIQNTNRICKRI